MASWEQCSVLGAQVSGTQPFGPSGVAAGTAAALALLADDRCRSMGACALSLCSASAQTTLGQAARAPRGGRARGRAAARPTGGAAIMSRGHRESAVFLSGRARFDDTATGAASKSNAASTSPSGGSAAWPYEA